MIKVILGLLLMLLGIYGFFWWHDALLSSGIDSNRNISQYYIPYILLGLILLIGGLSFIKGLKKQLT